MSMTPVRTVIENNYNITTSADDCFERRGKTVFFSYSAANIYLQSNQSSCPY